MPNSLKEIEEVFTTLWMNGEAREAYLEHDKLQCESNGKLAKEIDRAGIELYANLLQIGHHGLMQSVYPLCATILGKKWTEAVEDYLTTFPPNHYHLNNTAKRFPEYMEKHGEAYKMRFPFITELVDYEWLELELLEKPVRIQPQPRQPLTSPAEFIRLKPILNPTIAVRHYQYPILHIVSQIEAHGKPPKKVNPEPNSVAIYRDPSTFKCKFVALGNTSAKIIQSCLASDKSYSELLKLAITDNPNSNPEKTATEFLQLLEQFQELNVFVGTTNT